MAFRFSLETVLRLRSSLEQRDRLILQALYSKQRALQQEMRLARQAASAIRMRVTEALSICRVCGSEIQLFEWQRQLWEGQGKKLEALLSDLANQIERQIGEYERRRKDRRVLENVSNVQLRRYHRELVRREQAQIEELTLLRRGR